MPLLFNLRHLEDQPLTLQGELTPNDLQLNDLDELIEVKTDLQYELQVERHNQTVLIEGRLTLALDCQCARCLNPFRKWLELDPWNCVIPLEGEEKVRVENDCVDLTPFVREDILLAFPQHPLCKAECRGLPMAPPAKAEPSSGTSQTGSDSSAWAELNKLKF